MKNKIELLAPAGNFESLMAAINAGADSVYMGIGNLNMRAAATVNFQLKDLKEIAEVCHKNNIKVYITLNTVVYDQEIEEVKKIIQEIKKQKIDGIIASDLAVIRYANALNVPVHISTQMSVSNIESVRFFSKYAERIVLARELNLEQLKNIVDEIKKQNILGTSGKLVEVEVFAHGAMCVGISGRCQMSLYHYNLSANRGKCVQMCRRKYKVIDLETGKELLLENNMIMSRSDLYTIGFLDKLVEAGVSVLKIEGRGRGPEYVDTVIKTYRKALEAIENKKYNQKFIEKSLKDLKSVFNRGFSEGFYMGRKQKEWARGENNQATQSKQLVGQILHYYPKAGVIEILKNDQIKTGEKFIITGPTTGIIRGKFENVLIDGDKMTFKFDKKVRVNDRLFLICRVNKNK